ncbi:hypothetical protein RSOLAG1IB_00939 [Rhizoctonia solani AG-1 IB]|uniref:Uncharacterized protein n=1 Tax=Thanatephorus cucumeris (strain AG1-IB / isolate 7/3/14) TaxID=1108050 RepID=A0A0B7F851_THACB|nr:hypothetical protein RSOLAG1IB_00939 [Rhizoctonia solani AG-1 IB]
MAAPKNNLDELMRQRSGGGSAVVAPIEHASGGSSRSFKFKPAGGSSNATSNSSSYSSAPIPEANGLKKSNSEGPSRVTAGALVSAMARGISSGSTGASANPNPNSAKGGKRHSSEHESFNPPGPSPKRPKLGGRDPTDGSVDSVEDLDEVDPASMADLIDDDEAIWNEIHASSSAPAVVSAPAPKASSRQTSTGVSDQALQTGSRNLTPVNRSQFPGSAGSSSFAFQPSF